jgi:hypothetical protein
MLDFLTTPNYPKAAIGIEHNAITALSLRREGRGAYGIDRAATIELPKNLLIPSFTERNISSPQEFRVLLQEAAETAGLFGNKRWSIALPSNTARSAILTIDNDSSTKSQIEEVIDWKAEQSFGAPAGELRITRYAISQDREGKLRYFATAVKLSVIDEYETIFEQFGWKAGLILPRVVAETRWLTSDPMDSLLISSQADGFTAVLLRRGEPSVVRSVTCGPAEVDDEIYRLLMFYNDRFTTGGEGNMLNRLLLVGRDLVPERIRSISAEAFGRALTVLRSDDVGLSVPIGGLSFDDLAAPAGLASLGYR